MSTKRPVRIANCSGFYGDLLGAPLEMLAGPDPVDVLTGDPAVRKVLESGSSLAKLEKGWRKEIATFTRESRPFRLYP